MKNRLSLQQRIGVLLLSLLLFACLGVYIEPSAKAADEAKATTEKRSDLVVLEKTQQKPSLPQVVFKHDKHTQALGKDSCKTCHQTRKLGGEEIFDFTFQKTAGMQGEEAKNAFHSGCLSCHKDLAAAGKPTGPLEPSCRSCHNADAKTPSARAEMRFDKVLHNRHILAPSLRSSTEKANCATCHHTGYDAEKDAFIVKQGAEDGCFSCHMTATEKDLLLAKNPEAKDDFGPIAKRTVNSDASHTACVNCHSSIAAKGNSSPTGPLECAGCHDANVVKHYEADETDKKKMQDTRLERNQPDAVLMFAVSEKQEKQQGSMLPVSFNHKFHEGAVPSCSSCHHKKIAACSSCHTVEGKEDGGFVSLEKAMHSTSSKVSCVGCHNQVVQKPECAGCHGSMPNTLSKNSCASCHELPSGMSVEQATPLKLAKMEKEERANIAAATIAERNERIVAGVAEEDIPEKVTIGILSNEFEPSEFPHRKIVNTLAAKSGESKLARAFHTQSTTLCQSCHHNSPASKTPPRCVSCHAIDPQKAVEGVPALKAAYHLQCMTCHTSMNQKPTETDCNACHKPRVK